MEYPLNCTLKEVIFGADSKEVDRVFTSLSHLAGSYMTEQGQLLPETIILTMMTRYHS